MAGVGNSSQVKVGDVSVDIIGVRSAVGFMHYGVFTRRPNGEINVDSIGSVRRTTSGWEASTRHHDPIGSWFSTRMDAVVALVELVEP